jgi:hypothetical protein
MNEIQRVQDFPQLPVNANVSSRTKDIYLANNNQKIRLIDDKNIIVRQIHAFVNMTIIDKGVNMEKDDINYIKKRVTDDIMKDFKGLSLEDVQLAFYYGVRGEFGEYYGINPITFYGWLKSYKNVLLPSVLKEVLPLLPKVAEKEVEIDKKEFDITMLNNLCAYYSKLISGGVYDLFDIGNIYFSFMNRMEMIDLSEEEWVEINDLAMGEVKIELSEQNKNLLNQGKSLHRINLSDAFKEIEAGENKTYNSMLEIYSKRLALKKCLQKLVENKIDLLHILTLKIQTFNYGK